MSNPKAADVLSGTTVERFYDLYDALQDIHDDLETIYPWAYTLESTTIADFQAAAQKLNDKIMAALYPETE